MTDVIRTAISGTDLEMAIFLTIADRVSDNESFTAHDVTRTIRDENPDKEIPHGRVRSIVVGMYNAREIMDYKCGPDSSIAGEPLRYSPEQVGNG